MITLAFGTAVLATLGVVFWQLVKTERHAAERRQRTLDDHIKTLARDLAETGVVSQLDALIAIESAIRGEHDPIRHIYDVDGNRVEL